MNKPSQQELWEKIQNFSLDDPYSSYPFSKKLAQQNNWPVSFTSKAIEEYKKFIFLCCISPTGASPSETVDEVWHLHLTYTDNYWNQFCKQTLGKDIHHHPSKGGAEEKEKHVNWYAATLKLYTTIFNSPPPEDIWPPFEKPADEIDEPVYDPVLMKKLVIGFFTIVLFFATAVNLFHTKGPEFLVYYALIGIAGLGVIWATQTNKELRLQQIVHQHLPKQFTPFEITRFLYGPHRCYQAALVDLLKRGIIETSGNNYKLADVPKQAENDANPLLQPVLNNYLAGDTFSYLEGMGLIDSESLKHPAFEKLTRLSKKVDYPKFIIPGIVWSIGIARLLQGISNNKPVGFLVMEIAVFSLITLMILEMHSYTKTVRNIVNEYWELQNANGKSEDVVNNFSILGPVAIAGFVEYAILNDAFSFYAPPQRKWTSGDGGGSSCGSGSSCSSGCGSSCGGGGCGGCGS